MTLVAGNSGDWICGGAVRGGAGLEPTTQQGSKKKSEKERGGRGNAGPEEVTSRSHRGTKTGLGWETGCVLGATTYRTLGSPRWMVGLLFRTSGSEAPVLVREQETGECPRECLDFRTLALPSWSSAEARHSAGNLCWDRAGGRPSCT